MESGRGTTCREMHNALEAAIQFYKTVVLKLVGLCLSPGATVLLQVEGLREPMPKTSPRLLTVAGNFSWACQEFTII